MEPWEAVVMYFARLGPVCSAEKNPVKILIDLVTVNAKDPENGVRNMGRINGLVMTFSREMMTHQGPSPVGLSMLPTKAATLFRKDVLRQEESCRKCRVQ
jgi:hypothetical protein